VPKSPWSAAAKLPLFLPEFQGGGYAAALQSGYAPGFVKS
jgi:hypothetical protein